MAALVKFMCPQPKQNSKQLYDDIAIDNLDHDVSKEWIY